MSNSPKKSGARTNIADLKARLGLKKEIPNPQGADGVSSSSSGGILAPPGVAAKNRPATAVPVPPGAKPPEPELPSATDDPFGRMNAMAELGRQEAPPDIMVVNVNDGAPVEDVGPRSGIVGLAKLIVPALVTLIIGWIVGGIMENNALIDASKRDASFLGEEVKRVRKGVQSVQDALWLSLERNKSGQGYPINDSELTEALSDKSIVPKIDTNELFSRQFSYLDPGVVADMLQFFSNIGTIRRLVGEHVRATRRDAAALEAAESGSADIKPKDEVNRYLRAIGFSYRFGVVIQIPTKKEQDVEYGARLVEIGPPICQDRKPAPSDGKCPGSPIGFGVRDKASTSAGWNLTEFAPPQGETVPNKRLIPLASSEVFEALNSGANATVSQTTYLRRVVELDELVKATIELGNYLENKLAEQAI